MREMGLTSGVSKRFRPTTTITNLSKQLAPNILNLVFQAEAPNKKWVTDITYLPTAAGFVYLAVVLDLFCRKVVGWAMSDSLATSVVSNALRHAIETCSPMAGDLLLHSDRGCQYTSEEYQSQLRGMSISCSMSRTGCCYDNAVMERFFWSLKHEWSKFESFADIQEARRSVFEYITTFFSDVAGKTGQALDDRSHKRWLWKGRRAMAVRSASRKLLSRQQILRIARDLAADRRREAGSCLNNPRLSNTEID